MPRQFAVSQSHLEWRGRLVELEKTSITVQSSQVYRDINFSQLLLPVDAGRVGRTQDNECSLRQQPIVVVAAVPEIIDNA